MADNTTLSIGTQDGDTYASDDIGGVKYARGKLTLGGDGTNGGDVSKTNPMPVGGNTAADGSGTETRLLVDAAGNLQVDVVSSASVAVTGTFWQATQPVSAASLPLPSGAATAANQATIAGHLDGVEGLLTTIDADTSTLAGAVSGTEMQVDIVSGNVGITGSVAVTGTFWQATQPVSLASVPSHDVTNAGTFAVQAAQSGTWNVGTVTTVTTCSTVTTVSTLTGSGVAHDAADSGNPHKIGAKATAALSGITLVSAGDRTDLYAGVDGVQITRPYANLEDIVSGVAAITDGSSTSVIAAAGAGVKVYITSVVISNTSASAVTVDIRDGAAGTVKATFPVPANTSGVVCNLPVPIPFSANTAVCADPSAAASTVTVSLVGFKSKV